MKRRNKKITTIILIVIILLLLGALGYGYHMYDLLKKTSDANLEELESNKQTVYTVYTEDGAGIKKGTVLEEGVNVEIQQIMTSLPEDMYITEDDLGKEVICDLEDDTPVLKSMLTDIEINQDTRRYEVCVANLMTTQRNDEYVDVRIMFPTGEDYLVLPKKKVTDLNLENAVFTTTLSEDEILRFGSATVDAFQITGTYIYTTSYVEPSMQETATPTYKVRPEVIDLIKSDPNVLKIAQETLNERARLSLESRLFRLTEEQLASVAAGHGITDTAQASVLAGNAMAEEDALENEIEEGIEDAMTTEESTEDNSNE